LCVCIDQEVEIGFLGDFGFYASKEIHHADQSRASPDEGAVGPGRVDCGRHGVRNLGGSAVGVYVCADHNPDTGDEGIRDASAGGQGVSLQLSVGESEASRSEVRHVLQRFFGNSRERLLLSLLGDEEISSDELKRLKEAIANAPDEALEES
jgi:hypothetical protein